MRLARRPESRTSGASVLPVQGDDESVRRERSRLLWEENERRARRLMEDDPSLSPEAALDAANAPQRLDPRSQAIYDRTLAKMQADPGLGFEEAMQQAQDEYLSQFPSWDAMQQSAWAANNSGGSRPPATSPSPAEARPMSPPPDGGDGFRDEYYAATGAPGFGYREDGTAGPVASMGINDGMDERWTFDPVTGRATPKRPPPPAPPRPRLGRRVPGPVTLDGRDVVQGKEFESEEERAAYHTRGPNGEPSQADKDMRARGFVPVVTPDGVRYQLAADSEVTPEFNWQEETAQQYTERMRDFNIPGGVGRAGRRPDLTDPVPGNPDGVTERQRKGYPQGKYVRDTAMSPDGLSVRVLRPSEELKEAGRQSRQWRSLAANAGMSPTEAREFLESGGTVEELQDMGRKNLADRAKEKSRLRGLGGMQARYAGGQPTSASRAEVSWLYDLPEDQRQQALLDRLARFRGATPLDARAMEAKQAARMAAEAVTGMLSGQATLGQATQMQRDKDRRAWRAKAAEANSEAEALEVLKELGLTQAEITETMDEVYGAGWETEANTPRGFWRWLFPPAPSGGEQGPGRGSGGLPYPPGSMPYRYGS